MASLARFLLVLVVMLSMAIASCDSTLPPTTAGGGFYISTWGYDATIAPPLLFSITNITLKGVWNSDCTPAGSSGPLGDPSTWTLNSGDAEGFGIIQVPNGRVCATWTVTWLTPSPWPGCDGLSAQGFVPFSAPYKNVIPDLCVNLPAGSAAPPILFGGDGGPSGPDSISFSPAPICNGVNTGTITAYGVGFTTSHGMPLFQYFDPTGKLIAQTNATYVAPDGSSASDPVPSSIGSVPAGIYLGWVSNANAKGGFDVFGAGTITVVAGTPPQPPPKQPPPTCKPGQVCTQVGTQL